MADIELIIKIPEEVYEKQRYSQYFGAWSVVLQKCFENSIPLTELLDKIQAEIEQNAYPIVHGVNNHELGMSLYGILQVIDKYKSDMVK